MSSCLWAGAELPDLLATLLWYLTTSILHLRQGPMFLPAGLMLGPAFLGWVADMSSVQTALCVNAIMLLAVVAYFGMRAEEAHQ